MTVFVAVLGLAVLVFVHELGHFFAALAVGMRPRRFYVGFPPAICRTTWNGIEYGVGAVPLGGLVGIPGMNRPEPIDVDRAVGRAITVLPSLGSEAAALRDALERRDETTALQSVRHLRSLVATQPDSTGSLRRATKRLDDLEAALGPGAYWRAPAWKRIAVIVAGPAANLLVAVALFAGLFMTYQGQPTTTVESVVPGSPAAQLGLRAGDRIQAVDGARVEAAELPGTLALSRRPVVVVQRGHALVTLRSTGSATNAQGIFLAGTGLSAPAALARSLELSWDVTGELGSAVAGLFVGEGRDDVSSPVGVVHASSDAAEEGAQSFFAVLALVSLSLAVINLLPLLPLDGGHIAFAIGEGLGGRAARRQLHERASIIGLGIMLILFVVGLSNDIGRLS